MSSSRNHWISFWFTVPRQAVPEAAKAYLVRAADTPRFNVTSCVVRWGRNRSDVRSGRYLFWGAFRWSSGLRYRCCRLECSLSEYARKWLRFSVSNVILLYRLMAFRIVLTQGSMHSSFTGPQREMINWLINKKASRRKIIRIAELTPLHCESDCKWIGTGTIGYLAGTTKFKMSRFSRCYL